VHRRATDSAKGVAATPTRLQVRTYGPADFVSLHALDQQCFAPGIAYEREELRYFLEAPNATTLVAEAELKEIVGFITVQLYRGRPSYQARIITIDVSPALRQQGIGAALMAASEDYLRSQSVNRVRLEVSVENTAAQQFYRRFDYSVVGTIPRYYLGTIDALSMQKELLRRTAPGY
jgi:ribosomal-protein-alanine N-acetyltransferase